MSVRRRPDPLRPVFLLLAVAASLASCVHYEPRPITIEGSLEAFEERRLDAPELGAFLQARDEVAAWPPATWDLRALTLAAFYYSPVLDVARAQWGVAEGGAITAGARPNPIATGALGYNATTPADEVTPWIPEVALELPIDIAGKRGLRIQGARQRSQAAQLNVVSTAWQVRSRVRRAFLSLFVTRETADLLNEQEGIQTEIVRILDARLAAGDVSPLEATRARIDLSNSRVAALSAAPSAATARSEIADAVGVPPRAIDDAELGFDELSRITATVPPAEARRRALVNRSDIRASLAEYEASQSALQLEIRRQYPDISLGPGYQLDQTDSKWTLSLGIALPFFDRNRGPIAEASAAREAAAARFLALQSRVLGEVEASVARAQSAARQVEAADTLLEELGRREGAAQAQYDAGEISRLDLLGAQSETIATQLARLDALSKAQEALGALEDAMQSPLDMEDWILETPRRTSDAGGTQP